MSGRDTPGADRMLARGGRWTASVTVLLIGAGVAPFIVLGRGDQLWDAWVVHNALFGLLLAVVLGLTAPVEPRNPVVWIIALATAMSGIQVLTAGTVLWLLEADGMSLSSPELAPAELRPPTAILQWLNAWTWVLIAVPLGTFLPLLFPDGRLPDRRWRVVGLLAASALVLVTVAMMAIAWPTSTVPMADAMTDMRGLGAVGRVGYLLLLLSVLASLLGLATRARRATGVQRQQIRWVGLGAGLFALALAVSFVLDPSAELFAVTAVPGSIALVGSFAVAILPYRLYEIDRIISRTVAYAVVTLVLVAVYAAVAVLPSAVFELESDLLVAAATLLAAALFLPVRSRVQVVVDRRFDRARYDAARVVDGFGTRMRHEVDAEAVVDELRSTVAVRPSWTSVWLHRERTP